VRERFCFLAIEGFFLLKWRQSRFAVVERRFRVVAPFDVGPEAIELIVVGLGDRLGDHGRQYRGRKPGGNLFHR